MRNPLAVLMLVLALGGLGLWWGFGSSDSPDPLDVEAAEEESRPPSAPADLARPAPELDPPPEVAEPVPQVEVLPPEVEREREAVPSTASVQVLGRVVDVATGEGVPQCWMSLACGKRREIWLSPDPLSDLRGELEANDLQQLMTNAEGRFSFEIPREDLESICSIFANGAVGWHVLESHQDLSLAALLNEAEVLFHAKQWPPPVAGDVRGWLRSESGSFPANTIPRTDHLLLDLVSTALPAIERRAEIERVENEDGTVELGFQFKDVPEGEYNLTLSSLGHYRWTPTSLLVVPPMEGIVFLRYDLDEVLPLEFLVVDAETHEEIADFEARHIKQTNSDEHGVLLHTGPLEGEQFPLDQPFTWSVEADGYAVAYGNESAFEVVEGRRRALVELQPGWSTRFLIMGGEKGGRPRPLPGADIYLDGEFIGRSGPNGGLVVHRDEPPGSAAVRYLDWEPMNAITLVKRRSNVTPVVMAEPERD